MERKDIEGVKHVVGYHTQEFRKMSAPLRDPLICVARNSWLGIGYYFWTEIDFAHYWGKDSKSRNTGAYDVYKADLNITDCINTVFDEDGYLFYKSTIEETIQYFEDNKIEVDLEVVNRFLADNIWSELNISGIIFDDKPTNPGKNANRVYSLIPKLYYRKRIQIVIFSKENIRNFALHLSNLN